jgi:hypothetical protein
MLKESMPTSSARIASATMFRMTWSPLIGCPDASTVTCKKASSPNSKEFVIT